MSGSMRTIEPEPDGMTSLTVAAKNPGARTLRQSLGLWSPGIPENANTPFSPRYVLMQKRCGWIAFCSSGAPRPLKKNPA